MDKNTFFYPSLTKTKEKSWKQHGAQGYKVLNLAAMITRCEWASPQAGSNQLSNCIHSLPLLCNRVDYPALSLTPLHCNRVDYPALLLTAMLCYNALTFTIYFTALYCTATHRTVRTTMHVHCPASDTEFLQKFTGTRVYGRDFYPKKKTELWDFVVVQ